MFLNSFFDKPTSYILNFQHKNPNGLINAITNEQVSGVSTEDYLFLKGWNRIIQNRNYYTISTELFSLLSILYLPSYIERIFRQNDITSIEKFFRLERSIPMLFDLSNTSTAIIENFSYKLIEYSILYMCNSTVLDLLRNKIRQDIPQYVIYEALSAVKKDYVSRIYNILINGNDYIEKYYPFVSDILRYQHIIEDMHNDDIVKIEKYVVKTIEYTQEFDENKLTNINEKELIRRVTGITYNLDTKDSHILYDYLMHLMENLTEREYYIISKLWGSEDKPYYLEEISEKLHLTRERTRQIYKKALERLHKLYILPTIEKIAIYQFDNLDYISPTTTKFDIDEVYTRTKFYGFSLYLSLAVYPEQYDDYGFIKISRDAVYSQHYAVNKRISLYFDFPKLFAYVKEQFHNPLEKDIALNPIITNNRFWINKVVRNDLLKGVKSFLIYVCEDYFELNITDIDSDIEVLAGQMVVHSSVIKNYIVELLTIDSPLPVDELYSKTIEKFPIIKLKSIHFFKSLLADKSLFMPVGRKSLYQLASSTHFNGSVTKCIDYILQNSSIPIKLDTLIEKVLELRSDSNKKSVRSIISNRIKNHELLIYKDSFVGLISKVGEYSSNYQVDNNYSRMSFDERLAAIYDFIKAHNRLPLLSENDDERSLTVWYSRIKSSTNLLTKQLVKLYQLEQYIKENHLPTNSYEVNFVDNCNFIKQFILNYGSMPTKLDNEQLHTWLLRINTNKTHCLTSANGI